MNLDAVIIVLREVLEAALLGSLLLALAHRRGLGRRWFWSALVVGGAGAWWYASMIAWVSELWDYSGQEMVNAGMQLLIFLAFVSVLRSLRDASPSKLPLLAAMAGMVALALIRELSEILLYLQSYAANETLAKGVFAGGAIGFVTGTSVGIMLYFMTLWAVDWAVAQRTILLILSVVVAGILMQAVSLLLQVDRLPHAQPLWDSGGLVEERSVLGQLLYALIGYEATPTVWHVGCYVAGLLIMLLLVMRANPAQRSAS